MSTLAGGDPTRFRGGPCLLRGDRRAAARPSDPLDDRLPGNQVTVIAGFIDANELGLALEQMADVLSEDEQPLTAEERAGMLGLTDRMRIDDRVPRVLAACPQR